MTFLVFSFFVNDIFVRSHNSGLIVSGHIEAVVKLTVAQGTISLN